MAATRYVSAELRAAPEGDSRTAEFVISDETKDRHGTVLKVNRWDLEAYKKNPIVGYMHNVHGSFFGEDNPDAVIGKTVKLFTEGKQLIAQVEFEPPELNPLAEKIFQKVKFGTLRTASVGFMPKGEPEWGKGNQAKGKEDATLFYPGQELLEWSVVNIPSNPNAAKRELKDEIEQFLESAAEILGEDYTPEELRKMTMKGIVDLMTGEGVENDKKEAEKSEEIDRQKEEQRKADEEATRKEQARKDSIKRQLEGLNATLELHNNFGMLERAEKAEQERLKKEQEKDKLKLVYPKKEEK